MMQFACRVPTPLLAGFLLNAENYYRLGTIHLIQ